MLEGMDNTDKHVASNYPFEQNFMPLKFRLTRIRSCGASDMLFTAIIAVHGNYDQNDHNNVTLLDTPKPCPALDSLKRSDKLSEENRNY